MALACTSWGFLHAILTAFMFDNGIHSLHNGYQVLENTGYNRDCSAGSAFPEELVLSRNKLPPTQVLAWLLVYITVLRKCHMLIGEGSSFPNRGPVKEGSPWSAPVEFEWVLFSTVDHWAHLRWCLAVVSLFVVPSQTLSNWRLNSCNSSLYQMIQGICREKRLFSPFFTLTPPKEKKKYKSSRRSRVSFYIIHCVNLDVVTFEIRQISSVLSHWNSKSGFENSSSVNYSLCAPVALSSYPSYPIIFV